MIVSYLTGLAYGIAFAAVVCGAIRIVQSVREVGEI